jgi:predicted nucleic acid-binding protein
LIYFDTTYIGRLYFQDAGWESVRELALTDEIGSAVHGRAEAVGIFHRKLREHAIVRSQLTELIEEFDKDCKRAAFEWLPLSPAVFDRVTAVYRELPETLSLRAADALHLACAAENRFKEIYSNDSRLLAAAPHFGLKGINII